MKNLKLLSSFVLISLLIASCGNDNGQKRRNSSNLLPPLTIEVPNEVKNDTELVDLIKKSEKAINEFSDNVEILVEDILPIAEDVDEGDDLSTFQKLKVGKALLEFGSHSTSALEALETFNSYAERKRKAGEPLNDDQLKALAVVSDAFEKRMKEIDEKFTSISKKLDK